MAQSLPTQFYKHSSSNHGEAFERKKLSVKFNINFKIQLIERELLVRSEFWWSWQIRVAPRCSQNFVHKIWCNCQHHHWHKNLKTITTTTATASATRMTTSVEIQMMFHSKIEIWKIANVFKITTVAMAAWNLLMKKFECSNFSNLFYFKLFKLNFIFNLWKCFKWITDLLHWLQRHHFQNDVQT